jgi:energy-coupling factor transporter ATP-binding protein EcfA2
MASMSLAAFYLKAKNEFTELFLSQWAINESNLRPFFGRYSIKCNNSKKKVAPDIQITLYNVKYDSLCAFDEYWHYACRGSTIGIHNGKCVSFVVGLPKFFNDTEIPKYMKTETIYTLMDGLEKDGYSFILMNKEDGSNIRYWYDDYGYLHAYTLGTTSEKEMQGNIKDSPTFTGLAIKYLKHYYPKLDVYLQENPGILLVAELKSIWNTIVTKYNTDPLICGNITPLILIHPDYRMSWKEIRNIYPDLYDSEGNPLYSATTKLSTYDEDKQAYFKMQTEKQHIYGVCPEGFVLYAVKENGRRCLPVAKGKRPEYIQAHHHITLNVGSSDDYMTAQLSKLLDTYDDQIGQIGSALRDEHISLMEKALKTMVEYLNTIYSNLNANKFDGKTYAAIVKNETIYNGVWVGWMEPYLFKERRHMSEEFNSLDFIKKCLLTKQDVLYDIQIINIKFGSFWWDKSTHNKVEKKIKLVEEIIEVQIIDKQDEIAVFDFDKTLYEEEPNMQIVNMFQIYYKLNIPIIILTGRDMLEKDFLEELLASFGVKYTMYCRPSHKTVTMHKLTIMKEIATKYKKIYHFEDDAQILNQCAQIVNSNGGLYAGHFVEFGKVKSIINKNECIFVSLVGPPGSGKTSIFKQLEKIYIQSNYNQVSWISPDLIASTYKKETGQKILPEEMHPAIRRAFNNAFEKGGIVFVDMCNNKPDTIKDILGSGHKYILVSFMVLSDIKKKGKNVKALNPEYIEFIKKNVEERIASKNMNGSTLDCADATEIAIKKAEGCLHQILQRSIPVFADGILSIEEMVNILDTKIKEIVQNSDTVNMKMVNSATVELVDIKKLGEYVVRL